MARPNRIAAALPPWRRYVGRCALCVRRTGRLPCAGLAAAEIRPRHLHRISRSHQRPAPWRQPDCGRNLFWHRRDRERRQEEHGSHHLARPALVRRGDGRDPALLRERRSASGTHPAGHAAAHRPAACAVARPVYESGGGDRMERRADRYRGARAVAETLDRNPGRTDCRNRSQLWRIRRPLVSPGTLAAVADQARHPVANHRYRPAQAR